MHLPTSAYYHSDTIVHIQVVHQWRVRLMHSLIRVYGNKKVMKQFEKISKDLYIYYGVSEDDIKKKTERYLSLVTALSS